MPHCGEEYFVNKTDKRVDQFKEEEFDNVDDIKNFLNHIAAHKQVTQDIKHQICNSSERNMSLDIIERSMEQYQMQFETCIDTYIDDAFEEMFIKMADDFELVEGGLERGDEKDIDNFKKIVGNWVKMNFKGMVNDE